MQTNKGKLILEFLYKSVLLLVCFLSAYFITSIVVFPKNLQFIEGEKQYLNFKLPIKAIIEAESITTLKINDKEISTNAEFNLYKSTEVVSNEAGSASMTLNAFGIDVKEISLDFLPSSSIIPSGSTIGVKINTDGVMVLGTGYVNSVNGVSKKPAEGILKAGDTILKINNAEVKSKEDFQNIIESSEGDILLTYKRDDDIFENEITPIVCKEDYVRKIGIWVRDSTRGIGTMTYYDPVTHEFGALGHGIVDVDTKQLMNIKEGSVYKTIVTGVKRGENGIPGELEGQFQGNEIIGEINKNSYMGIYGTLNEEDSYLLPQETMKVALQSEIVEGPATIYANVSGERIEEFDIYIEVVNRFSKDDTKGMVIKITDPRLLNITGGIVQGMSGSPIIQNNKIAGAVTHVFVQDPTKGYGIFIENMLKQ